MPNVYFYTLLTISLIDFLLDHHSFIDLLLFLLVSSLCTIPVCASDNFFLVSKEAFLPLLALPILSLWSSVRGLPLSLKLSLSLNS